jgi:hypothetical protein
MSAERVEEEEEEEALPLLIWLWLEEAEGCGRAAEGGKLSWGFGVASLAAAARCAAASTLAALGALRTAPPAVCMATQGARTLSIAYHKKYGFCAL